MVTINKTIREASYSITGKREFDHQRGWEFKEPITIKKGDTLIDNFTQKKSILSMVKSDDLKSIK